MPDVHQKLTQALRQYFGFTSFRTGQEPVLRELLRGRNVLAVLPTGAGKTLIYQLYGLLQPDLIVIVSPLLSLMQDQVGRMQALGIKNAVALNSLLDTKQRRRALQFVNRYRYLYISPEMLSQPAVLNRLRQIKIGLFVIDEAHCVSQWGPDFRPEYLSLGRFIAALGHPQVLMLTATATRAVRRDVIRKLGFKTRNVKQIVYSVDRPNLFLAVRKFKQPAMKDRFLLKLVQRLKTPGIIYFSSKRVANQVAGVIRNRCHVRAEAYHSGLSSEARYKIQHQFMENQLDVICATSAFGMGIDKGDVRFVIHYHLPPDLNTYLQEIGRAGRDNKPSLALILYTVNDEQLPYTLLANGLPRPALIERFFNSPVRFMRYRYWVPQLNVLTYYYQHGFSSRQALRFFAERRRQRQAALDKMLAYVNYRGCRRRYILKYFGEANLPDHTARCCDCQHPADLKQLGLLSSHHWVKRPSDLNWLPLVNRLFHV